MSDPAPPSQPQSETAQKLDDLLANFDDRSLRRSAQIIVGLLGAFVLWAIIAPLDEVAIAAGSVVPQGRIKTVQHLEGGIIDELFVHEGDIVREGDQLIRIDLGASNSNVDELRVRVDGYRITKARLEAEATGAPLDIPTELNERVPTILKAEQETYAARQRELESDIQVLQRQKTQREHEVAEVRVRLAATENNLRLAEKRLAMSADLLTDKLQAPMDHLQIEREASSLKGELGSLRELLPRSQAALGEAQEKIQERNFKFRREAREQLQEVEVNIARYQELLVSASHQETRTVIRSPITGIVKNMRYTTVGAVVRPGEAVMDIVPSDDVLVIEAMLNPMDRGFVRSGQPAMVKIDTYDFGRYGGIEGEVISVAPDSTVPESGLPFFKVMVRTAKPYLGEESERLVIAPGMGANVEIHTGRKSVMRYLVKPILQLKNDAFNER